jgi:hypothetical protein
MAGPLAHIRLRVIALMAGRLPLLSGRSVGTAGLKGIFFHLVREALRLGTAHDFRQMLLARRPQVRVLGLVCLCLRRPPELKEMISPLLDDPAMVKVRPFGCAISQQSLAQLAIRLQRDPSYFGHRSLMRA